MKDWWMNNELWRIWKKVVMKSDTSLSILHQKYLLCTKDMVAFYVSTTVYSKYNFKQE